MLGASKHMLIAPGYLLNRPRQVPVTPKYIVMASKNVLIAPKYLLSLMKYVPDTPLYQLCKAINVLIAPAARHFILQQYGI
jgi:hypothetical protein